MSTHATNEFVPYGTSVSSVAEMIEKCSPIDCLARMLMGEARGESRQGKIACAWVVRNRQTINRPEFGAPDYKSIVTKGNGAQFNGIKSTAALKPLEVDANAWEECFDIASNFYREANPIRKCLWFNTTSKYNEVTSANGGKYNFGTGAVVITDHLTIGNHTFFTVEGYDF